MFNTLNATQTHSPNTTNPAPIQTQTTVQGIPVTQPAQPGQTPYSPQPSLNIPQNPFLSTPSPWPEPQTGTNLQNPFLEQPQTGTIPQNPFLPTTSPWPQAQPGLDLQNPFLPTTSPWPQAQPGLDLINPFLPTLSPWPEPQTEANLINPFLTEPPLNTTPEFPPQQKETSPSQNPLPLSPRKAKPLPHVPPKKKPSEQSTSTLSESSNSPSFADSSEDIYGFLAGIKEEAAQGKNPLISSSPSETITGDKLTPLEQNILEKIQACIKTNDPELTSLKTFFETLPPAQKQEAQFQLLCLAAQTGTPELPLLFKHFPEFQNQVYAQNQNGYSPLHLAVLRNQSKNVRFLITQQVDLEEIANKTRVNMTDKYEQTPLFLAAGNGHLETMIVLIELGANLNQRNKWGYAPLDVAVDYGHPEAVRLLLEAGADISKKRLMHRTPKEFASGVKDKEKRKEILALLKSASLERKIRTAMTDDTKTTDPELTSLKKLFKTLPPAEKTEAQFQLLCLAAQTGTPKLDLVFKHFPELQNQINQKNAKGETPLYIAVFKTKTPSEDTLECLIDWGAEPKQKIGKTGKNVLDHVRISNSNKKGFITEILTSSLPPKEKLFYQACALVISSPHDSKLDNILKNKIFDLDFKNENGQTFLHFLMETSPYHFFKNRALFLESHLRSVDHNGNTPFHLALQNQERDDNETSNLIRACYDDIKPFARTLRNKDGKTLIDLIIEHDRSKTFEVFLERRGIKPITPNTINQLKDIEETLHPSLRSAFQRMLIPYAIKRGAQDQTVPALQMLFEAFPDLNQAINVPDSSGNTFLHHALLNTTDPDVAIFFIHKGADITLKNGYDNTILHLAAQRGHKEIVELCLDKKIDLSSQNTVKKTPLHLAANEGNADIVLMMLQAGANPNQRDKNGNTPLHFAKNATIAEYLLKYGAEIDAHGKMGTPLHEAVENHRHDVLAVLLNHKADIQIKGYDDMTALHMAAIRGNHTALSVLLAQGADPNLQDFSRATPLHRAVNDEDTQSISILLKQNGINVRIKGHDGQTPLHRAVAQGNKEMVALFTQHKTFQKNNLEFNIAINLAQKLTSEEKRNEILALLRGKSEKAPQEGAQKPSKRPVLQKTTRMQNIKKSEKLNAPTSRSTTESEEGSITNSDA